MAFLHEIRKALNQKSVVRNILFCLAIIILMHLLYGAYRSSTVLHEGKKGKKGKLNNIKNNLLLKTEFCNKMKKKVVKKTKKLENASGKAKKKLKKRINKIQNVMDDVHCDDNGEELPTKELPTKELPTTPPPTKKPCDKVKCDTLTVWKDSGLPSTLRDLSAGPRTMARKSHGMVFIPYGEGGAVLVTGGFFVKGKFNWMDSAISYDVFRRKLFPTTKLPGARSEHGMVYLPPFGKYTRGIVMVAGGQTSATNFTKEVLFMNANKWDKWQSAPITSLQYEKRTNNQWVSTEMPAPISNHRMVFLPPSDEFVRGMVMVAGGVHAAGKLDSVLFYDLGRNVWQSAPTRDDGKERMAEARANHGMVFLPKEGAKGAVMVAGGVTHGEGIKIVASVEFYDVARNEWVNKKAMPEARTSHGMVFLPNVGVDGTVMVAGGFDAANALDSVFFYDVARNEWMEGMAMPAPLYGHGMVLIENVGGEETVVVTGGSDDGKVLLYDVAAGELHRQCCK